MTRKPYEYKNWEDEYYYNEKGEYGFTEDLDKRRELGRRRGVEQNIRERLLALSGIIGKLLHEFVWTMAGPKVDRNHPLRKAETWIAANCTPEEDSK